MALSVGAITAKQKLKALAEKVNRDNNDQAFFEGMIDIIVDLVKTGEIIIPPGTIISTGSPGSTANANPVQANVQ